MLLTVKLTMAIGAAMMVAGPIAWMHLPPRDTFRPGEPELVTMTPGILHYRAAGEFTRGDRVVNAPVVTARMRLLTIMRYQVTAAEYTMCVNEGACSVSPQDDDLNAQRPAVRISWRDASAYAAWLSRKTGRVYRLPTDEEWVFAAGGRFTDDAIPDGDALDVPSRWLARYDLEASRESLNKEIRAIGGFGINENGLADVAGNIWEWTDTCYRRARLDDAGREIGAGSLNCGVRIAAGRHRAYITDFIRDARTGGCAVGVPPSNLGFRLVRQ